LLNHNHNYKPVDISTLKALFDLKYDFQIVSSQNVDVVFA